MERVINKIRNCSGETIGETLVALLIGSLALTMLAGAVSSGARIIIRSREKMTEYYSDNNNITKEDASVATGELTVSLKENSDTVYLKENQSDVTVLSYTNDTFEKNHVISYSIPGG